MGGMGVWEVGGVIVRSLLFQNQSKEALCTMGSRPIQPPNLPYHHTIPKAFMDPDLSQNTPSHPATRQQFYG